MNQDQDIAVVHAITRRLTVAWLRRHLLGDVSMTTWLAMSDHVAAGTVTLRSK